jgi:hypothetical protein
MKKKDSLFNFIIIWQLVSNIFIVDFCTLKNLENKVVLEIGCGRGGGSNYISNYLNTKKSFGVDFSDQ